MLSSGVEPLLHSSVPTALEGLYLPGSSSTGHMAVAEPRGGLDAASEGARPALTHSDRLRGTTGVENFCQEREDLGDVLTVTSQGPTEPPPEESVEAGGLEEDEQNKKSHFRKLDCCGDGYRKEEEAAEDAEEHRAECCALAPGESWSKQEDPHLDPPEVKPWRTCCTETVGSLKSTENRVQVTAETLPKLTEEVQAMPCYRTYLYRVWKHYRLQVVRYVWKLHSLFRYQSLVHFQNPCHLPPGFQHQSSTSVLLMKLMLLFQPVLDPKMTQNRKKLSQKRGQRKSHRSESGKLFLSQTLT
ncbi:PREDICTED: protein PRR14L isoform X3 [Calidris pugnax]|uniref:protein PRR14L isoform X3 n=1 Tax=Calidris pugnax TaxID=198806 RepID=UPI00071DBAF1|nr:PREDICTED: protein PRR14L isoform X3 [Calidris pugnax]